MIKLHLIQPFIISLVLGAFLGFERAFATKVDDQTGNDTLGGIRTFSLISLLGCISAFIDSHYFSGFILIAFAGILVYTALQYYISYSKSNERGITTEVSILICFTLGVMVQKNLYLQATFITIKVLVVLYMKNYIISSAAGSGRKIYGLSLNSPLSLLRYFRSLNRISLYTSET